MFKKSAILNRMTPTYGIIFDPVDVLSMWLSSIFARLYLLGLYIISGDGGGQQQKARHRRFECALLSSKVPPPHAFYLTLQKEPLFAEKSDSARIKKNPLHLVNSYSQGIQFMSQKIEPANGLLRVKWKCMSVCVILWHGFSPMG